MHRFVAHTERERAVTNKTAFFIGSSQLGEIFSSTMFVSNVRVEITNICKLVVEK